MQLPGLEKRSFKPGFICLKRSLKIPWRCFKSNLKPLKKNPFINPIWKKAIKFENNSLKRWNNDRKPAIYRIT